MTHEEEVIRAGEAAQVLDSRIFREAEQRVIDGIHAQMRAVPLAETTMHTKLIVTLQCWTALKGYLEQARETGRLAEFQIAEESKKQGFWSRFS